MRLVADKIDISCPEAEIYNRLLALDNKHIVELGCGRAEKTREIAIAGINPKVTAFEVDEIALAINCETNDLPNVTFRLSGAEDIPLDDASVEVVLMFRSLHHVPLDLMETSLREIWRILKPGQQAGA